MSASTTHSVRYGVSTVILSSSPPSSPSPAGITRVAWMVEAVSAVGLDIAAYTDEQMRILATIENISWLLVEKDLDASKVYERMMTLDKKTRMTINKTVLKYVIYRLQDGETVAISIVREK